MCINYNYLLNFIYPRLWGLSRVSNDFCDRYVLNPLLSTRALFLWIIFSLRLPISRFFALRSSDCPDCLRFLFSSFFVRLSNHRSVVSFHTFVPRYFRLIFYPVCRRLSFELYFSLFVTFLPTCVVHLWYFRFSNSYIFFTFVLQFLHACIVSYIYIYICLCVLSPLCVYRLVCLFYQRTRPALCRTLYILSLEILSASRSITCNRKHLRHLATNVCMRHRYFTLFRYLVYFSLLLSPLFIRCESFLFFVLRFITFNVIERKRELSCTCVSLSMNHDSLASPAAMFASL